MIKNILPFHILLTQISCTFSLGIVGLLKNLLENRYMQQLPRLMAFAAGLQFSDLLIKKPEITKNCKQ